MRCARLGCDVPLCMYGCMFTWMESNNNNFQRQKWNRRRAKTSTNTQSRNNFFLVRALGAWIWYASSVSYVRLNFSLLYHFKRIEYVARTLLAYCCRRRWNNTFEIKGTCAHLLFRQTDTDRFKRTKLVSNSHKVSHFSRLRLTNRSNRSVDRNCLHIRVCVVWWVRRPTKSVRQIENRCLFFLYLFVPLSRHLSLVIAHTLYVRVCTVCVCASLSRKLS